MPPTTLPYTVSGITAATTKRALTKPSGSGCMTVTRVSSIEKIIRRPGQYPYEPFYFELKGIIKDSEIVYVFFR